MRALVYALISESNIVAHAARKQKHILLHNADAFAQFLCVPLFISTPSTNISPRWMG